MNTLINLIYRAALALSGPTVQAEVREDESLGYSDGPPPSLRERWYWAEVEAAEHWFMMEPDRALAYASSLPDPEPRPGALWLAVHTLRIVVRDLWHAAFWPLLRAYCLRFGHGALEDAGSYAGPESGADHFRCARCGEGWSHVYY